MQVTVFKIVGYELKTPDGNFIDSCLFWVYSDKANAALEIAQSKGIKKTYWTILEVIEKYEANAIA